MNFDFDKKDFELQESTWLVNATHEEKVKEIKRRIDMIHDESVLNIIYFYLGKIAYDVYWKEKGEKRKK